MTDMAFAVFGIVHLQHAGLWCIPEINSSPRPEIRLIVLYYIIIINVIDLLNQQ